MYLSRNSNLTQWDIQPNQNPYRDENKSWERERNYISADSYNRNWESNTKSREKWDRELSSNKEIVKWDNIRGRSPTTRDRDRFRQSTNDLRDFSTNSYHIEHRDRWNSSIPTHIDHERDSYSNTQNRTRDEYSIQDSWDRSRNVSSYGSRNRIPSSRTNYNTSSYDSSRTFRDSYGRH